MKAQTAAALAALTSLLMSGCAATTVGKADREVMKVDADTKPLLEQAKRPMPQASASPVKVTNAVWTTSIARRSEHGDPLPRRLESPGVTIIRSATMDLFEIGTAVTEATGVPVSFAADVFGDERQAQPRQDQPRQAAIDSTGQANSTQAAVANLNQMLGNMGIAQAGNAAGAQGNTLRAVTGGRKAMKVNHTGKLSAFLNQVGSHFGVTWEFVNGEIHIFRYVTRTYTVQALPSDISVSSTLDAGNKTTGATEGETSGSNQSAKSDVSVKIWEEITNAVEGIVGGNGRVSTSVGTGTLTVTAPSDVARRVQAYVDGQNARMTKQVAVSVQILNVSLYDADDIGFDLQGLLTDVGKTGISVLLGGPAGAIGAVAEGIGSAASTVTQNGLGFGIVNTSRNGLNVRAADAVVKALSERGRVSVVSTASVTTLNGIPAPLQVSNTRNYLERIEVTTDDTQTSTALTPGTVTTGFNLSLLPRALDDGSALMMQFGINISELIGKNDGFDEFTAGGLTIQLPNKNSRSFVQQAMVPNGSTLVLTGFEQLRNQATRRGTGHPDAMLPNGSKVGKQQRDVIVVMLTPVLLENKAPVITTH